METHNYDYSDGSVKCRGFVATVNRQAPLLLIAPPWRGQDDFSKDCAVDFARKGYTAFVIDVYGDGVCVDVSEAPSKMAPFFLNRTLLRRRLRTALDFALTLDHVKGKKVGALGFCFGGLCIYELFCSGAPLDVAVSLHGIYADAWNGHCAALAPVVSGIKGKLLMLHGDLDPMVSNEDLKRVRDRAF